MDEIDRQIIGVLSRDGRMTLTDLAAEISLGLSATSDRYRRLVADGVIAGFQAMIDPKHLGHQIEAVVDIRLPAGTGFTAHDDDLLDIDEVIDAVHLTGPFDYQLRVSCADVDGLQALLVRLKDELDVVETSSRIVLGRLPGLPRQPRPIGPSRG